MAVDAVLSEPVSSCIFPANREKYREFCKIHRFWRLTNPRYDAVSVRVIEISTDSRLIKNREFILRYQGIEIG